MAKNSEPDPDDDNADLMKVVGRKILDRRKSLRFTQAQLATRIGMTQSNVFEMEHGTINFSVRTLEKLARALEVDTRDLLRDNPSALPTRSQVAQLVSSLDRLAETINARAAQDAEITREFRQLSQFRATLSKFLASTKGHS